MQCSIPKLNAKGLVAAFGPDLSYIPRLFSGVSFLTMCRLICDRKLSPTGFAFSICCLCNGPICNSIHMSANPLL